MMRTTALCILVLLLSAAAHAQCPSTDDDIVQTLLNNQGTTGGVVQLDARVYNICQPLIVPSNVHLRGAGRGATIIRGAATATCKTVSSAVVCASIAAVAANNVSVSDLTVDNRTNSHDSNGIAFMPAGAAYDGQVSVNGLVQRVEVLGPPGLHTYQIWNFRGQHVKIVDNWVDGGSTSNSYQEGIESFGGYDVVIANNSVQNIGSACINLGPAIGVVNSETVGLFAVDNYLTNCQSGVHLGTAYYSGDWSNTHTHITGNTITSSRQSGIEVVIAASTHERELLIANNTIRGVTATLGAGILLYPSGTIDSSAILSTTIEGNLVADIHGSNAIGIRLNNYPNARIRGNTVIDTDYQGIYGVNTKNLEIVGNRVERAGSYGISVDKSGGDISSLIISGNALADWSTVSPGIVFTGAHFGVVRDNTFRRTDTAQPGVIAYDSASCGVTLSGNVAWYRSWTDPTVPACP